MEHPKPDRASQMAFIATWGLLGSVALGIGVLYLKHIGIVAFGPIPTLILPLSAFVVRSWGIAHFAPEPLVKRQRQMAMLVTIVALVAVAIAASRV